MRWPRRRPAPDPRLPVLPAEPVSRTFGFDRGKPVDRWYIERFLAEHAGDVRGRVLEVAERTYTEWYGGGDVTGSDVLYAAEGNATATVVGDLTTGDGIPQAAYDCFICTQTLQFVYDVHAAVAGTRSLLAPDGVLLATVPGISQISREDMRDWGDWWRFTARSVERIFAAAYGAANVEVEQYGNVEAAAAFLYGLAAEDLGPGALKAVDPDFHLLITVRAVRRDV